METSPLDQNPPPAARSTRFKKGFLVGLLVLLVLDLGLTAYAAYSLVTGKPDSYSNQHLGLLAGGLGQSFLVLGLIGINLKRPKVAMGLLAISLGFLAWQWSLLLAGRG